MKRSIKWKITFAFIIVVVCCICSILLFNALFLEKLYINEKKDILKKTYTALDIGIMDAYKNGYDLSDLYNRTPRSMSGEVESNFITFLREMQENYNVNIVLVDNNNKVYSLFQNNNRYDRRIMNYIFKDIEEDESIQILEETENYTITINHHTNDYNFQHPRGVVDGGPSEYNESEGPGVAIDNQRKKQNFFSRMEKNADIESFGFLSDKETAFFMMIPVSSIKEPITLFNKTMIIISLFIITFGSIAIYLIAYKMTQPLLKLSDISKKMSKLEFENKYEEKRDDEIGILGNSMNEMSKKLEKAVRELKNANVKLKKDLEQKEQLDLMRQEFVANVSHELKTPIALIQGYAEGLETEGIADNKESRDYYIDVIKDETDKMNHMVRELLDLSALERGMSDIEITRINLNEVVDGLIKSQDIKIKEKDIKLSIDIDKNTYVWADGYKLEEVVRNYFTNALNHVDDNKYISIYTENLSDDKIRLYVYNSGVKLNDEECNKIWDKFYKVDKAHTREYGGTGLGLSIVKAIAEKHNTICGCMRQNADNKYKDGMKFYFDFQIK